MIPVLSDFRIVLDYFRSCVWPFLIVIMCEGFSKSPWQLQVKLIFGARHFFSPDVLFMIFISHEFFERTLSLPYH